MGFGVVAMIPMWGSIHSPWPNFATQKKEKTSANNINKGLF
jgi:hypothetical protein